MKFFCVQMVGRMVGGIQDLEVESDSDDYDDDEAVDEMTSNITASSKPTSKSGGVFSMFR